ncbi:bridging integrator 3 isoform X1 [Octopus sinensis]|uniref:Bridging integrator 3 isoform X1 n=1 Tax=Octopus sinensis TaxID=2607531 RepID=A0A7E6EN17_9MOLL|nr:bridging integrator 3 isoform X1 [Octopus sinensis]
MSKIAWDSPNQIIFKQLSTPKRNVTLWNEEKEFEKEGKKLEELEETCRKLYKDSKKCSETASSLSKCERRITQDLMASTLCKSESKLMHHCEEWDNSIVKLNLHMQEMNSNIQKTLVEPVKKFSSIFPSLHAAEKKREQALEEYKRCEAKVKKYQERERTGNNIVKLNQSQKSLTPAKEEFYELHTILMEDMPKLYDLRISYYQPCIEALIKSQVAYNSECYKIYSELAGHLAPETYTSEEYGNRIQQKLSDIKTLSIVD